MGEVYHRYLLWEGRRCLGIDRLGLLLSIGGWLLYWRKRLGDGLYGVFSGV